MLSLHAVCPCAKLSCGCVRYLAFLEIKQRFEKDADFSGVDLELSHFCELHAAWSVVMPALPPLCAAVDTEDGKRMFRILVSGRLQWHAVALEWGAKDRRPKDEKPTAYGFD